MSSFVNFDINTVIALFALAIACAAFVLSLMRSRRRIIVPDVVISHSNNKYPRLYISLMNKSDSAVTIKSIDITCNGNPIYIVNYKPETPQYKNPLVDILSFNPFLNANPFIFPLTLAPYQSISANYCVVEGYPSLTFKITTLERLSNHRHEALVSANVKHEYSQCC